MRFISCVFSLAPLVLSGCLAKIMDDRISEATYAGAYAQQIDNWDASRRAYAQAVVDSEIARWPAAKRAVLHYEYGRALGVTCFYAAAGLELLMAYNLDEASGGPVYMPLVELARLHLDHKKYEFAVQLYEKSIVELDKRNRSTVSPISYADIHDEYALALKEIGEIQKSDAMYAKAKNLRAKYPGWKSITERTPYGTQCTQRVNASAAKTD